MSDLRAILVSREQRDWLLSLAAAHDGDAFSGAIASGLYPLCAAFNAAGDQPRIPFCVEHGSLVTGAYHPEQCKHGNGCRVVDAIVVPLKEPAS